MRKGKAVIQKRDLIPLLVICVFVLGFIGWRIASMAGRQIEDQNGDADKSLAVITDADIESTKWDYVARGNYTSFTDKVDTGVDSEYEDYDNNKTVIRSSKVSGVYLCNAYMGAGKEVTYKIDSKVEKGNMRIVLVCDTESAGKIIKDIPIDSAETLTFFAEKGKTYCIKFVAESAKMEINIQREIKE